MAAKAEGNGQGEVKVNLSRFVRADVKVAVRVRLFVVDGRRNDALFTASAEAMASTAPAAPNMWPVMDFVELMTTSYACSPNAFLMASVSLRSLSGVLVPCALM